MDTISSKTHDYKININKLTENYISSLNDEFSNLTEIMEYYTKNKNLESEIETIKENLFLEKEKNKNLENKIIELESQSKKTLDIENENIILKEKIIELEKLIDEKNSKIDEIINEHKEFNKLLLVNLIY